MKIPTIAGIIDRRILINYHVDPAILMNYLPKPFRPKLVEGRGIAGICFIRLKHVRPAGFPPFFGIRSENAAHRIAVEWTEGNIIREGVYIPRRDTNSRLNHWSGGRLFPGIHHLAAFDVFETDDTYEIDYISKDKAVISVSATHRKTFPAASVFKTIEAASGFFKNGSIGFSPGKNRLDGLKLIIPDWQITPLSVKHIYSSFFEDESVFPKDSVIFDNALLMNNVAHTWESYDSCPS